MKISPICNYGGLKPYCEYEILEEGIDYFLTKNGIYIPKYFTGRKQLIKKEQEEMADKPWKWHVMNS